MDRGHDHLPNSISNPLRSIAFSISILLKLIAQIPQTFNHEIAWIKAQV